MGSTEAAIVFDRVCKRFGSFTALEETSLDIFKGEFFSLLGPSGCGKTTSLRLIAGFEQPTAGNVVLGGVDVSGVPPYRRDVNTVFQQYALFPHLSVFDNVAFGLRARKVPAAEVRTRVHEMLEVVHLPDLGARKPSQLSGGQQQRVALARALVNLPTALLLDEPLGALDLKLRKAMQLELKRIQRDVGITFVYVTHDQEEALTMSDRIAVMNRGRVEQLAGPEEIYHRPATSFVAGFIGTANLLPATVVETTQGRCVVHAPGCGPVSVAVAGVAFQRGQRVALVLRPERLRLHRAPVAGAVALDAVVRELTFQGATIRCGLRTSTGEPLEVHLGPADGESPGLGDRVQVSWPDDAAHLVPAADGEPPPATGDPAPVPQTSEAAL